MIRFIFLILPIAIKAQSLPTVDEFWTTDIHGKEIVDTLMIKGIVNSYDNSHHTQKKRYTNDEKKRIINKSVNRVLYIRREEEYSKNHIKT